MSEDIGKTDYHKKALEAAHKYFVGIMEELGWEVNNPDDIENTKKPETIEEYILIIHGLGLHGLILQSKLHGDGGIGDLSHLKKHN